MKDIKSLNNKMGKIEVYNFLKKHKGKWFTTNQISEEINNVRKNNIGISLRKLREENVIESREIKKKGLYRRTYENRIV